MRVINSDSCNGINIATFALEKGGVIAYPTETSYGLACDMRNREAVEMVYKIKGRLKDKPLPVLVGSIEMAREYVEFSERAKELAEEYWPGAMTMVLPVKIPNKFKIQNSKFKIYLIHGQTTLALRISSNPFAQKLVQQFGRAISATSANISGNKNIYDPKELIQQFKRRGHQPDLLIDAGVLSKVQPSTILEMVGDEVNILRQGAIKVKNQKPKAEVKSKKF